MHQCQRQRSVPQPRVGIESRGARVSGFEIGTTLNAPATVDVSSPHEQKKSQLAKRLADAPGRETGCREDQKTGSNCLLPT